ncbi:MAG TPA: SymE family type I addiction module toxin [Thermoanaerobaculia bacterium]|nr:SymE family type I addiction module toxin [Thermoanaerobaculia bacterium]
MPKLRTLRRLTVTNRSSWPTYRQVPQIRMCGDWLGQVGFMAGTFLDIAVAEGILVITRASFAGGPDPEVVRKAVEDLQREYRRRFQYKTREEQ